MPTKGWKQPPMEQLAEVLIDSFQKEDEFVAAIRRNSFFDLAGGIKASIKKHSVLIANVMEKFDSAPTKHCAALALQAVDEHFQYRVHGPSSDKGLTPYAGDADFLCKSWMRRMRSCSNLCLEDSLVEQANSDSEGAVVDGDATPLTPTPTTLDTIIPHSSTDDTHSGCGDTADAHSNADTRSIIDIDSSDDDVIAQSDPYGEVVAVCDLVQQGPDAELTTQEDPYGNVGEVNIVPPTLAQYGAIIAKAAAIPALDVSVRSHVL